jgi:esterase/lipase superfamily enzyme
MSSEMATTSKEIPKSANFLPAVDLLQFLENTHTALLREALKTPEEYGQKQRIEHLRNLLANALPLLRPTEQGRASLLLHARPRENRGLSILLPPSRTETQVNAETGPEFSLANSNYLKLRFSQRVHWAALMGAFMLITEKPHTLWRVISSVLADASGPGRDALLQRLVSKSSVIDGLSQQFKSLSSDAALTLSLEPRQTRDNAGDAIEYLLRLESSLTGATVAEQTSRVYQPSVDAALDGLEQLLQDPRGTVDLQKQLESLGRTLGEDLIQRLCDRLHQERDVLRGRSVSVPHLRLQIPRELMRFPWELMHDSRGLLCERFAFGRQVFMETDLARRRSSTKCGVIRALVVGDPHLDAAFADEMQSRYGRRPVQLAGAQSEARTVVEAFHHLADELVGMPAVVVESRIGERVSCMQMREYLRSGQFDIIHYAGHAQFVKSDPEASAWVLSDGMLRAREIRNTLAWTDSPPWLVFANACEAGMDAGASIGKYQGDVFGLATAFINQSVAAYIAPLWPVDDRIATELAVSFYYALLAERLSLGESLYRAKAEVRRWLNERDGDSPDVVVIPRQVLSWASVILYGDPTRRLLESLWSPQIGATKKAAEPPPETSAALAEPPQQRMRGFIRLISADTGISDEPRVYPVWFGTNRKPVDPQVPGKGFSHLRDDKVYFGVCDVLIPETHKFGSLGSSWWKRWATGTDDRVRLIQLQTLAEEAFWQSIRDELAKEAESDRAALVYLHGFNVSFETAAVRAAQIGFDLKVPGLTAFFSWPSRGRVSGYVSDGTSIEASERHIAEFLTRFAQDSGATRVHLIAHSMGNRGLLRSIQRIARQATDAAKVRFGQIFLAAPDVDSQTFADLARLYSQVSERTTLYVSSKDLALAGSSIVNDYPRAGFIPPVTIVDGIDTIEVSSVDLTMLGHGYYGGAEGVLYDMHELLLHNVPPQRRTRIRRMTTADDRTYWSVHG